MNDLPLIAGVYKVIGEIGSGGGGVVYLAEHQRLGKKVVLKADKRKLTAKLENLRREADALKNLSHTYIPQVYDFVEEDGVIYTVMAYIDGESFDKPLKRGERFTQAQIIEWACQLLEAIVYLHTREPHGILHADIKPANVMLTPQGDIRLIDFNIALALGEEGVAAVGISYGYSSPEHYGIEYSSGRRTQSSEIKTAVPSPARPSGPAGDTDDNATLPSATDPADSNSGYTTLPPASQPGGSGTAGKKTIMLNVRSDIYSLGATLYHFMTGRRPAQNAPDVQPISTKEYSPAVVDIITKAMNPDQSLRWQTAKEMLYAFEHLRDNDYRTKRHKRSVFLTAIILSLSLIAGAFTAFIGLKQMERLQNAYVMAEYSGNALRNGDVDGAIDYALRAFPAKRDIFTPPDTAEAQKALTDALNVYDLSDGFKAHKTIEFPSAPLYLEISPDGKTAACIYAYEAAVFNTDTAEIMATLPAERSALSEIRYIDNDTVIFAGDGGVSVYDIKKGSEAWRGKPATSVAVSADGATAAAVYKDDGSAFVYDLKKGAATREVDFGGKHQRVTTNDIYANPSDNLFALNRDGTMLGVSFSDGSLKVYDLRDPSGDMDIEIFGGDSGYVHFDGGFYDRYFAFSAVSPSGSTFAVIDIVEMEQTGGFDSQKPFSVQTDNNGIYLQTENLLVKIHPVTGDQTALVTTAENISRFARSSAHTLITSKNEYMFFDGNAMLTSRHEKEHGNDFVQIAEGTALIGSLDSPVMRIMKIESHRDAEIFSYDPAYPHTEARISRDGKTAMLFSYAGFRLYDIGGGSMISEISLPDRGNIYDQQYRRDGEGSRLEVTYYDGTARVYSAADGSLMSEETGEKPGLESVEYEEFFTDRLRIESPLHGTPAAYDVKSGRLVKELEKDGDLTYVTQSGEYIITQYISGDDYFYGLLLNGQCETLAYLPYLCDVVGDELVFDYPTGNLRKTRIYNIDELIGIARESTKT